MNHAFYKVRSFQIQGPYKIRVEFDDATNQVIDFEPILYGSMLGPLRDLTLFNQVRIDREVHTLVWPNGADFDPAMLHDWPIYAQAVADRSGLWKLEAEAAVGKVMQVSKGPATAI